MLWSGVLEIDGMNDSGGAGLKQALLKAKSECSALTDN
jgi:hypothetical protein